MDAVSRGVGAVKAGVKRLFKFGGKKEEEIVKNQETEKAKPRVGEQGIGEKSAGNKEVGVKPAGDKEVKGGENKEEK